MFSQFWRLKVQAQVVRMFDFFLFAHSSLLSPLAQAVKNLTGMQKTWVQCLGQEDPLEKEMAIHSSSLAWKIPWTEEPGGLQPMGSQRVAHN